MKNAQLVGAFSNMGSVIPETNKIPLFTINMDAFNHNIAIKPREMET